MKSLSETLKLAVREAGGPRHVMAKNYGPAK